jgi:hypothetical protein
MSVTNIQKGFILFSLTIASLTNYRFATHLFPYPIPQTFLPAPCALRSAPCALHPTPLTFFCPALCALRPVPCTAHRFSIGNLYAFHLFNPPSITYTRSKPESTSSRAACRDLVSVVQ